MNSENNRQRIQKCGWLKKQGGLVKTWHNRWFVLNGDCLFYFSKDNDIKPLGSIFLPGNRVMAHRYVADEPEKYLLEIFPGKPQQKMAPNHDSFLLCALSDAERQEWIKSIRRVMHKAQGGAIFGQPLEETMIFEHRRNRKIPYIIESCVEFISQGNLDVEGLFRLSGRATLVRELEETFDTGQRVKFEATEADVHTVASLLKLYLRELPESIIPCNLYQKFMNIALRATEKSEKQEENFVLSLQEAVEQLPDDNYNVLEYLCKFLQLVSKNSAINKMTISNLALVFGPNIIRHMDDNPELFRVTADLTHKLTLMLIKHSGTIFERAQNTEVAVGILLDLPISGPADNNILIPQPGTSPKPPDINFFSTEDTVNSPNDPNWNAEVEQMFKNVVVEDVCMVNSKVETISDPSTADVYKPVLEKENVHKLGAEAENTQRTNLEGRNNGLASFEVRELHSSSDKHAPLPVPPLRFSKLKQTKSNRRKNLEKINKPSEINPAVSNSAKAVDSNSTNLDVFTNNESTSSNSPQNSVNVTAVCEQFENMGLLETHSLAFPLGCNQEQSAAKEIDLSLTEAKEQIRFLRMEQSKLRSMHKLEISKLKKQHQQEVSNLENCLIAEKNAIAESVHKIVELQNQLNQYQIHFGILSTSARN